ncbi:MAG: isoprenyl transferase [Pseudobdellovibrionaceae bacterium]
MSKTVSPKSPQHVAIIMDGNGRWAKSRGLPRTAGHKQGIEAVRRAVESACELNIPYLTLFGFSAENWNRPEDEVTELMGLLRFYLRSETAEMHKNNIRLQVIGLRETLAADIVELIENAEKLTRDNTRLHLTIALNYGGRQEIVKAVELYVADCVEAGRTPDFGNVRDEFPNYLMTADIPDPDLLIRTSGEQRISNFLLWQCAYSEFTFPDVLWPDFDKSHFEEALSLFARRDRRYGALSDAAGDVTQ